MLLRCCKSLIVDLGTGSGHVYVRSRWSGRYILRSFTGLTQPQTKVLAEKAHIYMTADGRISMAGLNGKNIEYFAESVSKAVKGEL